MLLATHVYLIQQQYFGTKCSKLTRGLGLEMVAKGD